MDKNGAMKNVTFTITVEEANLIFKALSKFPFEDVFELIGKLNEQSNQQLRPSSIKDPDSPGENLKKVDKPRTQNN